jgi:hypothetical protein
MSQVTHLASGALTRSGDQLLVELVPPDSCPPWSASSGLRNLQYGNIRYAYRVTST